MLMHHVCRRACNFQLVLLTTADVCAVGNRRHSAKQILLIVFDSQLRCAGWLSGERPSLRAKASARMIYSRIVGGSRENAILQSSCLWAMEELRTGRFRKMRMKGCFGPQIYILRIGRTLKSGR
ncbi:hypothetical protein F4776DRAFT_258512 [Hypoxylon sp. NC0597]|nr:hypothetical protein F4776DRAFT_258512 [Hypoxylon sp. NC0597]